MAPTIKPSEMVNVDYLAYSVGGPKRWDVVAFEPPGFSGEKWLLRIVGLPGEVIYFTNGSLLINGPLPAQPARLAAIHYTDPATLLMFGSFTFTNPFVVPSNAYYVLGDNVTNANDSRFSGSLPRTNILGKVLNK
jgi:signal peptidase I